MSSFFPSSKTQQFSNQPQKQQHKSSNLVKSIIYGNILQTSYGMVRALCSAISSKDHIDKIVLYLRNNHNFLKYNKFIYSFRLEHTETEVFITQNFAGRQKFLEGYNDDTGFQGVGQKLLALLQKFNVRNVLVVLAVRQRDPLKEIYAQNYVQMVKCAKQLLSSLYDKVVHFKNQQTQPLQDSGFKEPLQQKQFKIPLDFVKQQKPISNPNYVGQNFVKKFKPQTLQSTHEAQIAFLSNCLLKTDKKIKQLAAALEEIIQKFGQAEDTQVKFAVKYDQNKKIQKVFDMLAILFEVKSKQAFLDQNISTHLKSITSRNLTSNIIRKLNEQIMSDRSLRSEILMDENQVCGILMAFIEALLKSYGFAKKLAMIESEIQEANKVDEASNNLKSGTLKGAQKILNE